MKNLVVKVAEMKTLVERIGRFTNKKNKVSFYIGLPGQVTSSTMKCMARISSPIATAEFLFEASAEGQELSSDKPLQEIHVVAETFCNYIRALLAYNSDISLEISESSLVLRAGDDAKLAVEAVPVAEVEEAISKNLSAAVARMVVAPSEFAKVATRGCSLAEEGDSSLAGQVFITLEPDKFNGYSVAVGNAALARCTGAYRVSFVPEAIAYVYLDEFMKTTEATKAQTIRDAVAKIASEKGSFVELAKEHGLADTNRYTFSIAPSAFNLLKSVFSDAGKHGVEFVQLIVTPTALHVSAGGVITSIVLSSTASTVVNNLFTQFGTYKWSHKLLADKEQLARAISLHQLAGSASFTIAPTDNALHSSSATTNTSTVLIDREGNASEIGEYSFYTKIASKVFASMENGNAVLSFTLDEKMKGKAVRLSNGAMDGSGEDSVVFLLAYSPAQAEADEKAKKSDASSDDSDAE